jgi:hypothetical protein
MWRSTVSGGFLIIAMFFLGVVNLAFDFLDAAQTTGAFFLRPEGGFGSRRSGFWFPGSCLVVASSSLQREVK